MYEIRHTNRILKFMTLLDYKIVNKHGKSYTQILECDKQKKKTLILNRVLNFNKQKYLKLNIFENIMNKKIHT